ncbi:MAG: hypothetical protein ABI300_06750 [Rhodanobacter sp.]
MPAAGISVIVSSGIYAVENLVFRKKKIAVAAAILSIMVAVLASSLLIGSEARVVDVLTLFATGFGAGAAAVVLMRPAA